LGQFDSYYKDEKVEECGPEQDEAMLLQSPTLMPGTNFWANYAF
jgi:hypothetical protein